MYKSELHHPSGQISVRVVAASTNAADDRINAIYSYELEYPRFIHSELMTHRLFSRNAMSSRAVPIKKMIEQVRDNPAMPVHWGQNQPGMQAKSALSKWRQRAAERLWRIAARHAAHVATVLDRVGAHKQIVNRILEPFQRMKTVVTATEWNNFFWLRCHADAQPEILELAKLMQQAHQEVTPDLVHLGGWHLPYIDQRDGKYFTWDGDEIGLETAKKVSSSCCAQVSYRLLNTTVEKAVDIYNRLAAAVPVHASPFEHIATPIDPTLGLLETDIATHQDRAGILWSGNLRGWGQYRQVIDQHVKW